ncbi:hypothetical protein H6F77_02995 [Microcoleus sp. FACHB-831]|uniref:hypothetical protein n=1 Tax=Microcoleus sp. FACHB-831 TaxID=2692827 RepID=UPI001684513D|nr:hypothetical protein [Microcoleus sp. FACHB-831]MBD1920084.1 hypothetical protein [Microcoleus sp. FACHB-831]
MNEETASKDATQNEEIDPATAKRLEVFKENIKHPPAMIDTLEELSPAELLSNPAVAPEMVDDMRDIRGDLTRD